MTLSLSVTLSPYLVSGPRCHRITLSSVIGESRTRFPVAWLDRVGNRHRNADDTSLAAIRVGQVYGYAIYQAMWSTQQP